MKILKIESCKKCPVKTFSFVGYDCKLIRSLLHPLPQKGIHKDCPLEDAPQQDANYRCGACGKAMASNFAVCDDCVHKLHQQDDKK